MRGVFVGFGSNLGDKVENCRRAVELLGASEGVEVLKVSSLWRTEPWGFHDQDWFLNGVLELETTLGPRELLGLLKAVEVRLGRTPTFRWGPRVIDLDLLLYGQEVIREDGLEIPHPHLHERAFVLVPLAEIAPDAHHPLLRRTAREMLEALGDPSGVEYFGSL